MNPSFRPPENIPGLGSTPKATQDMTGVEISDNAVDKDVDYTSKDSMFFDLKEKKIHLWGEAEVKYQTMTIKAEYIIIDWETNEITAEGRKMGKEIIGKPNFTEGEQNFDSEKMRYNFKTEKGIIYQAATKQEGMNVIGAKAKYIGAAGDTTSTGVIYNSNAIITTCQHDHPHFGIRSRKQKVIPDKVAVTGLSNIEIMGIPTPLVLPFGFFPLKQQKSTGLIFPQNYQYSATDGFGLEEVGWYFPINDYWNLKVTGDIYFKGTFGVRVASNYRRRYKNNGNLMLGFNRRRTEIEGRSSFNPSWNLRWSHNQDGKAHPYQTFGGSINLQTNNYQSQVFDDFQSVSQSSLNSNLSYRRKFRGPYSLTASFNHSQNTRTRDVRINFPNVNFQTQTIYPFKRKEKKGDPKERWYEKISFRYTGEMRNTFEAKDTTLFTQQTLDDARYGIRHSILPSMSFTVAKYFTVTPSVNYKEVWYFNTIEKTFNEEDVVITVDTIYNIDSTDFTIVTDTTQYGSVTTDNVTGFEPFRQFNAGVSVNTQLFGTILFKKGFLRGLRHVVKPSISFNYTPDYTNPDWGYFKSVRTDIRSDEEVLYNIFEQGIFDRPSSSGRQMALRYSINNIFEAKIFSKRDSTEKKVKLLQNVSVSGNYNFAADTLQFSQVRVAGTSTFFNNMTTFNFGWTFDPYTVDDDGRRINRFHFNRTGKFLRFVNSTFRLSTRLTVSRIRDMISGINSNENGGPVGSRGGGSNVGGGRGGASFGQENQFPNDPLNPGNVSSVDVPQESILDIFQNFSINHNFTLTRTDNGIIDTTRVTAHTIDMRGSIPITNNWNINVGNFGYDFQAKRITYPSLGFSRDLHCWQLGFNWTPQRDSYGFFLRVKPGRLDFINVPYNKGRVGASFGSRGRF